MTQKNKKTLEELVKKQVKQFIEENSIEPDVFECKIAWKGSKDGQVDLIRIYDGGNSENLPDDDNYLFYPRTLNEFYRLFAKLTEDRLENLPDYDEISEYLTEKEWGDSGEDFVIVDVLDMWSTKEPITKQFTSSNGYATISRLDYYTFPCPMCANEFDDEKMQKLADTIGNVLENEYKYTKEEITDKENEDCQDSLWREIEDCALAMGMKYLEDMEEEK